MDDQMNARACIYAGLRDMSAHHLGMRKRVTFGRSHRDRSWRLGGCHQSCGHEMEQEVS